MKSFENELRDLINVHSQENGSDTADYILAQYLLHCLHAFNIATNQRDAHNENVERGPGDNNPLPASRHPAHSSSAVGL